MFLKMFKKVVKFVYLSIAITFAAGAYIACDIGLGGAVDTEAPTGSISSPDVNAVIRDAFAIKGTWADDGAVGQITVSLRNTTTNAINTYNASVDGAGTWLCAVNPSDSAQPLADGTYLATVTIYDNGGHTSTLTRSYTIDNTAPVVILSYLKSKDDTSTEIKTYGKNFSLSGKAADDNNINRIDVKVYQDEACSTELKTITKLNVPASIEQDVATFGTTEYTTIYGSESASEGTKTRYCKVFAYDYAQRYPVDGSAQTDSDELGNCQTSYYFQTTIEKLGYDKYKTNDLYAMFNGTYPTSDSSRALLSADEISTVKANLTNTAVSVGTFALNPKNNPTYTVIGLNNYLPENQSMLNELNKPDEKYYVTNGSGENGVPLTITLTPGRDNYAINESTVNIYLQECDDKGLATGKIISLASNVTSFKTKTLSTANYSSLNTDSFYKVCVEGSDTKGNLLEADISGIYAFYFAPDTKTLELFVTGSPDYISSKTALKDLTMILTYSYNGTDSNPLYVFRKFQTDFTNDELTTLRELKKENPDNDEEIDARNTEIDNLINQYILKDENNSPIEPEIGTNKKFTDIFDATKEDAGTPNKDKTYVSYFIMSKDKTSFSNTKDYYIHVDDAEPTLTVTKYPTPSETSDNSFWFEGTSDDGTGSGVSKVLVKIKDESVSPAKETDWLEASGTAAWKLTIIKDSNFSNTENPSYNGVFLKEGKKKVLVKAIDNVGLESAEVQNSDWIYKTSKPKFGLYGYFLDENDVNDTSKRISKRESDLISNTFDFAIGQKFILSGFATDAYGIDSITVTENGETRSVTLNRDINGEYIGTWQTELFPVSNLPSTGSTKTYTYIFTIKDLAGIETPSKELKITIDLTPPVVEITSLGTGKFGVSSISGTDVTIRGTASDPTPGTGLDFIKYAITSTEVTEPSDSDWHTVSPNGNDWSITKVLKEGLGTDSESDLYEGKKRLHIKAIDKAGNETNPAITQDFCVDQKSPEFDEVKVLYGSESKNASDDDNIIINKKTSAENFHLEVKAHDTLGVEGVNLKNGNDTTPLSYDSDKAAWISSNFTENAYSFVVEVEDKSGNGKSGDDKISGKTTPRTFTVLFDKKDPEFTLVKVKGQEFSAETDNSNTWYNSQTVSVEVEANDGDNGSGIEMIECVGLPKDAVPTANTEWTALTKKTEDVTGTQRTYYKGSVIFPEIAGKESRLYIRATDKAENEALFKTKSGKYIAFNIDMTAPEFKSLFYQVEGGSVKNSGGTVYLSSNKKITVYGSCKDDESLIKEITSDSATIELTYYKVCKDDSNNEIALTSSNINDYFKEENKASTNSERRYWKVEFTPSLMDNTSVDFNLKAENGAGITTTIAPVFSMIKDTEVPTIVRDNVIFTKTTGEVIYMKGTKGGTDEKYYVNNKNAKFTITGISTDNVGLDSVALKGKDSSRNEITISATKSGSASTWTFSDIDLTTLSDKVTLYIEVTDLAGNTNTEANQKIEVIFDKQAPKGKHLLDEKGKDIYFRIGNAKNDDNENETTTPDKYDSALDDDAGSKYSAETYSNTTNLEIRGLFDDGDVLGTADVSGLKTIYYKVYKKSEYISDFDNLSGKSNKDSINSALADIVKSTPTGTIVPLSTEKERRVFYTDSSANSAGSTLDGKLTSLGYITAKDGSKKHWAKIKSNFDEKLTGFSEENNYLVLVAEDNVGNYAVDFVEINTSTAYNNFSLNVDTHAPVPAGFKSPAEFTNASDSAEGKLRNGDVVITGTVADYLNGTASASNLTNTVSELKSLTIKVGNTSNQISFKIDKTSEKLTVSRTGKTDFPIEKADIPNASAVLTLYENTDTNNNILTTNKNDSDALAVRNWKATIPGSYFKDLSGNVVIYAIAKDNAGNEISETAANIIVDKAPPTVTLNKPSNVIGDKTVNGIITLRGTVEDSYLTTDSGTDKTLGLYYTTKSDAAIGDTFTSGDDAATGWKLLESKAHASSITFSDIDTTTLASDLTPVFFIVRATDKAGNIGYSNKLELIVDQDTDRPEITIKNLSLVDMTSSGVWAKNNQLFGTVNDDDGISEVYVLRKNSSDPEPLPEQSASDEWGDNLLNGGIWQYTIPKDGLGVFYFKVVDSQTPPKTYISSAANPLQSTPKIYDNKSTPNKYGIRGATTDSRVYLKVDTTKPEIRNVFYKITDSTTTSVTVSNEQIADMLANSTQPTGWEILTPAGISNYIGGTSSRYLWILYDFWDDNGIKEIETEKIKREDKEVNGVSSEIFSPSEDATPKHRLIKFDLSALNSGDNKLTLSVKDQADSSSELKEYTIKVDNTAPTVDIRNPQDAGEEYGSLSVSGSGSITDEHSLNIQTITGLYFAITSNDTKPSETSDAWTNIKECVTIGGRWNILFDKDDDTGLGLADDNFYHAKKLNEYLKVLYPSDFTGTEDIYKDVYFWVYSVDSLGNSDYESAQKVKLTVYTQADKPNVTIEYPDSTATTLAGMIRISGTAEIKAEKVASVWLKIDPDYGTSFDDDGWESKLTSLNSIYTVEDSGNTDIGRAIKVDGTTSWHYTINAKNEFGKIDGVNRKVYVKAYALSSTNKASELKEVTFTINPDKPQIKSAGSSDDNVLILVNKADPTKKIQYEENMWISGDWYLEGSVRHGAGIYMFTYTEAGATKGIDLISTDTLLPTGQGNDITLTQRSDTMDDGATAHNWDFKIPVGAAGDDTVGTNEFTIRILDNGSKASEEKTIKLRYDNKAPNSFVAKTIKGEISANKNFRNSNGQFALSGTIRENEASGESGVKRIAFYFTREAKANASATSTTTYFIDPLITKLSSATTEPEKYRNNYVDVSSTGISYSNPTTGGDGLYWCEVTGVSVTDKILTFDALPSTFAQNVRMGGLCKMNNAVYTIKGKTTEGGKIKITLDSAPAASDTAYFALAQVIDNTSIETGTTNLFTETDTIVNPDGDCMQEGLTGTGGNYEWQANINSTNIYDGPVTLHFVYYDKAGNYKSESFPGMICNNAPRIASVAVKSDYDGNETFEDSANEISRYYPAGSKEVSGVAKSLKAVSGTVIVSSDNTTSGSAFMVLKDKSAIDVEMVGGNGNLHYEYAIGDSAGDDSIKKGKSGSEDDKYLWVAGNQDDYDESSSYVDVTHTHTIDLPVSFFIDSQSPVPNNTSAKPVTWFQYKIWDDTDGTEKFVDSQNVTVQIALDVQVTDIYPPNVVIDPFFWNSASDNSLYQNKTTNGHIELENDWKQTTSYDSSKAEYDGDPKVSGKIVLRGYVYDNKRLTEIKVSIPKSTVLSSPTTVAIYDNQNKTWKDSDTEGDVTGLSKGTIASDGWHFTVSNLEKDGAYFDDRGHKVMWTFEYDTEKVTDIAASDVVVTVIANDCADKTSTNRSVDADSFETATKHKPTYQMDVVPYVTKVYTKLAKGKVTNWSVYNRTALGHYPVQSVVSNIDSSIKLKTTTSEDITLYGFNLNDSSAKIVSGSNEFTTSKEDLLKLTNGVDTSTGTQTSGLQTLSFNAAKLSSGKPTISVNNIIALNNINDNDAHGDASEQGTAYANWYNRQGNGDTNNLLNDDIEFDVWEFNDRAAIPINGLAAGINMEVNQTTGMLNYAFANGGLYFSMGGYIDSYLKNDASTRVSVTSDYSSFYWSGDWDTFAGPCVGFHVDELGYTYSVVSGGDTNSSGSVDKWDLYTSRWGTGLHATAGTLNDSDTDNSHNGFHALRLEENALRTGTGNFDYSLMKYRYLSPEFASTVNGTSTNLYLVYYDALTNQIRFRAGTFSVDTKPRNKDNLNEGNTSAQWPGTGGFRDQYTSGKSSYYNTGNCQIIANASSGATFKTGYNSTTKKYTETTVAGMAGRGAGQYVDVAVVKNGTADVVCVVWYDADANCCKFSYITDPISNWNSLKGNTTAANWSTPVTVFDEGGEYCHIVADKNNHLHVAAYAGNGDVMYAYIAAPTVNKSDVKTCTVDASGTVGEHLTLDVAINSNGHAIPYIGYYTSAVKKPKYAYLVDPSVTNPTATFNQFAAGVDDYERFTGAWEVAVVPSPSSMTTNREDKINVGVWKNNGTLTDSKVNNVVKNSSVKYGTTGYDSENWSKTYGNGTANGVLGYQISTSTGSCLETAQMR